MTLNYRVTTVDLHSPINPGVFTRADAASIACCDILDKSGALIHQASGGTIVAECLICNRLWRIQRLPTLLHGPLPIDAEDLATPTANTS